MSSPHGWGTTKPRPCVCGTIRGLCGYRVLLHQQAGLTRGTIGNKKEKKPKLFLSTRNPHSFSPLQLHPKQATKKSQKTLRLSFLERKTRVCPSAPHSVYQAIAFAQYYTPNLRDTWVVSRCRFRVRLLPYKLQNYSCLRQIYE